MQITWCITHINKPKYIWYLYFFIYKNIFDIYIVLFTNTPIYTISTHLYRRIYIYIRKHIYTHKHTQTHTNTHTQVYKILTHKTTFKYTNIYSQIYIHIHRLIQILTIHDVVYVQYNVSICSLADEHILTFSYWPPPHIHAFNHALSNSYKHIQTYKTDIRTMCAAQCAPHIQTYTHGVRVCLYASHAHAHTYKYTYVNSCVCLYRQTQLI